MAKYTTVYGYQSCDPGAAESHVRARFSKLGCAHDSDLPYLFQWDDFEHTEPKFTADQKVLAIIMGRYWGNFAATGDPNGKGLPLWPKHQADTVPVQLLEVTKTGGVRTTQPDEYRRDHHLEFWDALATMRKPTTWITVLVFAVALVVLIRQAINARGDD